MPRSARAGASSRQGDPLQCAERITRRERTRRGRDQRVHRNPATIVTSTNNGTAQFSRTGCEQILNPSISYSALGRRSTTIL